MTKVGTHTARRTHRHVLAGVLATLVVLDVGVSAALVIRHHHRSGTRAAGSTSEHHTHARAVPDAELAAAKVRLAAIRSLLAARARAVVRHDRAGFLAVIEPRAARFRARQGTYFDNLREVPLRSWSYVVNARRVAVTNGRRFHRYAGAVWAPRVILHYSLRGPDRSATSVGRFDTFVRRGGRWYLAADSDFSVHTPRELWETGPVVAIRHGGALVLGHPGGPLSLQTIADEAARDLPRVTAVWGSHGWTRSVVVLVPNTEQELSRMLCGAGDLSQIAAVSSPEIGCASRDVGPVSDRVIVNPPNFATLGPLGRQVVMTHEITHVATRSVTGPLMPTWLIEGIADYVGYRDTGLAPTVAARELAIDLSHGRRLGGLPTDNAYRGLNPRLPQAYERSWLACKYLVATFGQRRLVQLYRVVGRADSGTENAVTDAAMRAVLHVSLRTFTAGWRTYTHAVIG